MKSFQQKRFWRSVMYSKPMLVVLGVLVLIFAWSVIGLMLKMMTTRENRQIAENRLAELSAQREGLSREIAKLETESGKEESIRERFPVAKEGESVIVIIDAKDEGPVEDKPKGGFLSALFFWKNWFK